jgi:hypothetical protein
MTDHHIAINNSDGHDPPLQFMVVDRFGLFVDLSKVHGQLFDPNVLEITWGERTMDGRTLGRVKHKNGTGRTYWDPELIEPYLRAWKIAHAAGRRFVRDCGVRHGRGVWIGALREKLLDRRDFGLGDGPIEWIEVAARFEYIKSLALNVNRPQHQCESAPGASARLGVAVLVPPSGPLRFQIGEVVSADCSGVSADVFSHR